MTTTQTPRNLNHAAQRLIEALDEVGPLSGFRRGLAPTLTYTAYMAEKSPTRAGEARQALAVWQALDDLAAAVLARREEQ